jgi:hypothetical protein
MNSTMMDPVFEDGLTVARDFSPTSEQITLHGLGFIQVRLPGNRRMHVWHPDLPRRACFQWSAIHNHRFSFRSTVLIGQQVNRRYNVIEVDRSNVTLAAHETHDRVSHDGARSEKGGRLSFVAGGAIVVALPNELYFPGDSYEMPILQYHETPNDGVVVTIMEKLHEGTVHASTLIECGHQFDQDFDRFQLSPERLWAFVIDALKAGCE